MRWSSLLGLALATSGCFPCPQSRPIPAPDGGVIACVRSADCLVEAGTLVCTMELDRSSGCIECRDAQCVRWTPEACR